MIATAFTRLAGVRHPIVLGGMGGGTSVELVAAVSNAGALGILSATRSAGQPFDAATVRASADRIRERTSAPFGMNLLLFETGDLDLETVIACAPRVVSTAWCRPDQDLRRIAERVHAAGALFMHQVDTCDEAKRAAEAGADVVVAQGTEAGGHVGLMATLPLVRMTVRAVAPLPVVAAGGIADGAAIAAVLMLGAEGALIGTRFLATDEAPLPRGFKEAIVASDGHDTILTEIPDIANARVWPGAYARAKRNAFIERWAGREADLRRERLAAQRGMREARASGNADEGSLLIGQDAGLVDAVEPAGALVERLAREARDALRARPDELLR